MPSEFRLSEQALAKQRKKDDQKKKALITALHAKALALLDTHKLTKHAGGDEKGAAAALAALDAAIAALHLWAGSSEHVPLTCGWHNAHGRHATALNCLNESLSKAKKTPAKSDLELKVDCLEALGWAHWAGATRAQMQAKFPLSFPLVFKPLA